MIPIPDAGQTAWLQLGTVLAEHPPPPCAREPDAWWTDAYTTTTAPVIACDTCPARAACLAYALAADERWGIWGGTTPDQRRQGPDEPTP